MASCDDIFDDGKNILLDAIEQSEIVPFGFRPKTKVKRKKSKSHHFDVRFTELTTLRLQFSASGSKMKLDSSVKPRSNISKKAMMERTDNHCSQTTLPDPS